MAPWGIMLFYFDTSQDVMKKYTKKTFLITSLKMLSFSGCDTMTKLSSKISSDEEDVDSALAGLGGLLLLSPKKRAFDRIFFLGDGVPFCDSYGINGSKQTIFQSNVKIWFGLYRYFRSCENRMWLVEQL